MTAHKELLDNLKARKAAIKAMRGKRPQTKVYTCEECGADCRMKPCVAANHWGGLCGKCNAKAHRFSIRLENRFDDSEIKREVSNGNQQVQS